MIPALLGNIVGGGLMVATMYWYLNLTGEPPVTIDGVPFEGEAEHLTGQSAESGSPERRESSNEGKKAAAEDMV